MLTALMSPTKTTLARLMAIVAPSGGSFRAHLLPLHVGVLVFVLGDAPHVLCMLLGPNHAGKPAQQHGFLRCLFDVSSKLQQTPSIR